MKVGFALPQFHQQAFEVARVAEFARGIEAAGGASLWVGDRNLAAVHPKVGYGGQGTTIPAELNPAADPFVVLGVAASATEHVLLGTHVLVAPLYPPVQLARSLTTIDLISAGRLLAGFGVGWSPEEYEAAGLDFATRGARMDELLRALEAIWTTDPAAYDGDLVSVPPHHAPLKPARRPRPPLYLGGQAERALRRVAQHGDGWLPFCVVPSWIDLDELERQRAFVDEAARKADRDPDAIDSVLRVNIDAGTSSEQVVTALGRIRERTGIRHVMIDTMYSDASVDQSLERASEILDGVRKG
ncbi:TIGR03619 family F420-dependent LLM class oxidoreductase [Streptomyces sp. CA-111067]|uniref:TIGR03619 family F420-dependent LLM class oxidoreductase n=1 Tax=Streptomyces sp. CA-111067 TaxID=3240046 RepID=UPI003D97093F